jgi:regulator of sigma E protease
LGMHSLILASWSTNPVNWLLMAGSIGLIIFVHELGHFLVAKWCGVRCDKFYLGFDIGGWKICSFTYGETEYGIGILPLGGYVKMLGQDDNPGRAAEEAERTRLRDEGDESDEDPEQQQVQEDVKPAAEEDFQLDPRSYTAKSVPQRMAIISAGVIMNLIFAVVFAAIAYAIGVPYTEAVLSHVTPGGPAWEIDLRAGDDMEQFGNIDNPTFNDLRRNTPLTDEGEGISLGIARTNAQQEVERFSTTIYPVINGRFRSMGIVVAASTVIAATVTDTPAEKAEIKKNDRIIRVGGTEIAEGDYGALHRAMVRRPDLPVDLVVERPSEGSSEQISVTIQPRKLRRLGLIMAMGKIAKVQQGSPAEQVGIQVGDFVEAINLDVQINDQPGAETEGVAPGDPITLPERVAAVANREDLNRRAVIIKLKRNGEDHWLKVTVRAVTAFNPPTLPNDPIAVPALGIAYRVINRVVDVIPGSPAEKAGFQKDDVIEQAKFESPEMTKDQKVGRIVTSRPVDLIQSDDDSGKKKIAWPRFMDVLQHTFPGTKVTLTFRRDKKELSATMEPYDSPEFYPNRGLEMKPLRGTQIAESFGEAISLGFRVTLRSVTAVFRTLRKIPELWQHMGGMITIFRVAGMQAEKGIADLLIFMCLISANLAVINFLPIPVLDGGHMVLLAAEAIRRKPVSERILIPITYAGLFFILGLFILMTVLDIDRLIDSW